MNSQPKVLVCGPVSWNQLVELDKLPEPRPQQLAARTAWHTAGGTSAGKALHLNSLAVHTLLFTPLAGDEPGSRLRRALLGAGVDLRVVPSETTEQHLNLMAGAGRVSIYLASPSTPDAAEVGGVCTALGGVDLAVIDLSELGLRVIKQCDQAVTPIWVDLHDYDGVNVFHQPFVRAASVVFMNDDATDDPWKLLATCLQQGPELAVCTLGERGAVAMSRQGERWSVAARSVEVVDTNGAGDAFMAGFVVAHLRRATLQQCLEAATDAAAVALSSRHLHPMLADLLE